MPSTYEIIRTTPLETIYQIYHLDGVIYEAVRDLGSTRQYIENMRGYADMALLALVVKALQAANARFGDATLTKLLETHNDNWSDYGRRWQRLTQNSFAYIWDVYRKRAKAFRRI